MSNIQGFNDSSNNKIVQIESSDPVISEYKDSIIQPSLYKIFSITSLIIFLNFSFYAYQIIVYYSYYKKIKQDWRCLLYTLGAFQGSRIKNHKEYYRFFISIFMHKSFIHLFSNALSLIFLGYQTEHEINNKTQYLILYLVSGLEGDFMTFLFDQTKMTIGASGAIIGLCGNFVIVFLLNYRRMSKMKLYYFGIMFLIFFINLFSGLSEGGENINTASHFGGFFGGFAYSIILKFKNYQIREKNTLARRMYFCSIVFLFLLPLISTGVVAYKKVPDFDHYFCKRNQ